LKIQVKKLEVGLSDIADERQHNCPPGLFGSEILSACSFIFAAEAAPKVRLPSDACGGSKGPRV